MDPTEVDDIAYKFRTEYPIEYKRARGVTDNMRVLALIAQNRELFNRIDSHIELFSDLESALFVLDLAKANPQHILLQFTALNLWGLYTEEQFAALAKQIMDIAYTNGTPEILQITIAGNKQKLVFECLNPVYAPQLVKTAGLLFNVNVNSCGKCIIVDKFVESEAELMKNCTRLYNQVYNEKSPQYADAIKFILPLDHGHRSIRKFARILAAPPMKDILGRFPTKSETPNKERPNKELATVELVKAESSEASTEFSDELKANMENEAIEWINKCERIPFESVENYYLRFAQSKSPVIKLKQFRAIYDEQMAINWIKHNRPYFDENFATYHSRYIAKSGINISGKGFLAILESVGHAVNKDNIVICWNPSGKSHKK